MRVGNFYFEFDDFIVPLVFIIVMVLLFGPVLVKQNAEGNALEELGCDDRERFMKQTVCQIGDTYYFVDIDCNSWGLSCTAQLVSVEGLVVEVR